MITHNELQYTPYYGETPIQSVYWGNNLVWQKAVITDPYEGYNMVLEWNTRDYLNTIGSSIQSGSKYGNLRYFTNFSTTRDYGVSLLSDLEETPSMITKTVSVNPTVMFYGMYRYGSNFVRVDNTTLIKILKISSTVTLDVSKCTALQSINYPDTSSNSIALLSNNTFERMTNEDLALANSKGWTIAQA